MTHPAILKAQSLYDECPGQDLEPNQQALIATVNRIGDRKASAYAAANRVWGDIPLKYRACLIFADAVANAELTAALEAYDLHLEYLDEIEEIALNMAVA